MNIGVVVVLYHPSEENLRNIAEYLPFFQKAVLVDNSSEPLLSDLCTEAHYMFLGGNKGIGEALNKGAHFLLRHGMDAFVTMDQDSTLNAKILSIYRNVSDKLIQVGCLTPQYQTPRHVAEKKAGTEERFWTMQSGTLFFKDAFLASGDFREDYFIDGVDYEYCLRLRKNGYRILRCNEAILLHDPAVTCEFKIGKKVLFRYGIASPDRYYYQIRNMICIGIEYRSIQAFLVGMIKIGKIVFLFPHKREYLKKAIDAICDGMQQKTGKI